MKEFETVKFCPVCHRVFVRYKGWVEFTPKMQVEAQKKGCHLLEKICPDCDGAEYICPGFA